MRLIRLFLLSLCFVAAGLVAAAPRAFAENRLESSEPKDGATVAPPDKIQFFFTENTDATQLRVLLEGPTGALDIGVPAADDENTISVAVPALASGDYSASWRVGSAGGLSGAIHFTVTPAQATTTATGAPASTETSTAATTAAAGPTTTVAGSSGSGDGVLNGTSPAQAVVRFAAAGAVLVLVGSYLVLLLAWPAGLADPASAQLLRAAAVVGVIGTLVVLLLAPDGAGDALSSLGGRALAVRLVLLVIASALLFLPGPIDEAGRRDALTGSLAAILVTFPFAAHGAKVRLEVLGVVMGVFHVAGVAVFVGGLVLIARVVLAAADPTTALHVVRRVTRLFGLALATVVVTGLIDAWRLVGSPGDLTDGWHGRLLLVKTLVAIAMVVLWMGLREVIEHGLRRLAQLTNRMRARLARAVALEILAGLVAVLLSAFLVAYRPAAAGKEQAAKPERSASVELTGSRFSATVRLDPGEVGNNRLTVRISGDTTAVTGFTLRLLPVDAAVNGVETTLPVPKKGAVVTVDNVPIAAAGQWRVELAPIGDATGGTLTGTIDIAAGSAGSGATTTAPSTTTTLPPATGVTTTTAAG